MASCSRAEPERCCVGWRRSGAWVLAALVLSGAPAAQAKVHYARNEALQLAFPDADRIDTKTFFLTEAEARRVEGLAKAPLESKLVAVHVGEKDGEKLGYAFIDTQIVRTLPETLLVVVSPQATVQKLLLLAFYEPPEYEAPERWLEQFASQKLDADLRVDREIHGIAGATLTSHAVTAAVRRSLALYQVLIGEKRAE